MHKKLLIVIIVLVVGFFLFNGIEQDTLTQKKDLKDKKDSIITLLNQGGSMEGHTPRGFMGMGTGLFVGDNLNPNFPEGDGVQAFITFDLSEVKDSEMESAFLFTDNVHITGTPFADLGNLIVEGVRYDVFSKDLFNIASSGTVCSFAAVDGNTFKCDVSSYVKEGMAVGAKKVQFKIRFDRAGDGDGTQDMISFYATNANTNEAGIFKLYITDTKNIIKKKKTKTEVEDIHVRVVAYLVKKSGGVNTQRDIESLQVLLKKSQKIWAQADVVLDISIKETVLPKHVIEAVATGDFRKLYALLPKENNAFYIYYVSNLLGPNGIALAPNMALVADITSVDDFRASAHEIGHLLGLVHTLESRTRLMFGGANGRVLSDDEISTARTTATLLFTRAP